MSDEFTLTLNSPITEEQWDIITDVDFDNTNEITFHTKHGKEVKFVKASTQPEPCEDAVSRSLMREIGATCMARRGEDGELYALGSLDMLPPVTPKRKTGRWVNNIHDLPVCDQCGYMTPYDRAIDDYEYGNYCPNCGAKMEVKNG